MVSYSTDSKYREKLFAILTNLVKNAIKYSNEGLIEFGCKIADSHGRSFLQFFVKDTGIGIPKDRQHAVFCRFVQADIEDREARQGAGLGLAIRYCAARLIRQRVLWYGPAKGNF